MKKYLGVHDHKELIRDPDSKGLINIDNDALNKYKEEREFQIKLARVLSEHDQIKSDISDIKELLLKLVGK